LAIVTRSLHGDGQAVDVGLNRYGRPMSPRWLRAVLVDGCRYARDYIELKCAALETDPSSEPSGDMDAGTAGFGRDVSELVAEIGIGAFRERSFALVDGMKEAGPDAPFAGDLPPRVVERLREAFKMGALLSLRWTDDVGEIPDADIVRSKNGTPLVHLTKGKRKVLDMFCAQEYGRHEVIAVLDACPDQVTLVDYHKEYLDDMRRIYPAEWNYVHADYKEFLREAEEKDWTYDLIVADPWSGMCRQVGLEMLPVIMGRCTDMFICHYGQDMFAELGAGPDDLDGLSRAIREMTGVDVVATEWVPRGGGAGFLVLRKPES
jgi:hypothetical protein